MTDRNRFTEPGSAQPHVLLLDVDAELTALLRSWLVDAGLCVTSARSAGGPILEAADRVSTTIVYLPFPRQGGVERLVPASSALRARPIVALSPAFGFDVSPRGSLAAELHVAAVLPVPVGRQRLVSAVVNAVRRARP